MTEKSIRHLIVNADDLGLSEGVNEGIIRAHENGIVTSASLMIRYPAARAAAAYGKEHPDLALGLHFDIGEWFYRDGEWVERYQVVRPDDESGILAELMRQLECFREWVGEYPTHLDSHQHIHRHEPARSILLQTTLELGIPLRDCSDLVCYDGRFYGQDSHGEPFPEGVSIAGLLGIFSSLPPGISELGCHPGLDFGLESAYRYERAIEVDALCDARARSALEGLSVELVSFRDVERLALEGVG